MASNLIIGFDPGTARTGFGVITAESPPRHVKAGLIETSASESAAGRLQKIAEETAKVLAETKPDVAAVERLFFARNTKTAISVAEARGVIISECAKAGLAVSEYTPLEVKQSVTSFGRADKAQVGEMVTKLLRLSETPRPDDVADALAIALCHQAQRKTKLA